VQRNSLEFARHSNRIVAGLLAAMLAALFPLPVRGAERDSALEYRVKAAFLYNFAKFVEWPDRDTGPIVLGVLGQDPFGAVLDQTVEQKSINGRPVVIRHFANVPQAKECHIVFVGTSEKARFAEILPKLASFGILTVGERHGFLQAGGMVNFVVEDNNVHFEINAEAVRHAGIHINSNLLKLSRSGSE
jgi:YfiR/HmsC-like